MKDASRSSEEINMYNCMSSTYEWHMNSNTCRKSSGDMLHVDPQKHLVLLHKGKMKGWWKHYARCKSMLR